VAGIIRRAGAPSPYRAPRPPPGALEVSREAQSAAAPGFDREGPRPLPDAGPTIACERQRAREAAGARSGHARARAPGVRGPRRPRDDCPRGSTARAEAVGIVVPSAKESSSHPRRPDLKRALQADRGSARSLLRSPARGARGDVGLPADGRSCPLLPRQAHVEAVDCRAPRGRGHERDRAAAAGDVFCRDRPGTAPCRSRSAENRAFFRWRGGDLVLPGRKQRFRDPGHRPSVKVRRTARTRGGTARARGAFSGGEPPGQALRAVWVSRWQSPSRSAPFASHRWASAVHRRSPEAGGSQLAWCSFPAPKPVEGRYTKHGAAGPSTRSERASNGAPPSCCSGAHERGVDARGLPLGDPGTATVRDRTENPRSTTALGTPSPSDGGFPRSPGLGRQAFVHETGIGRSTEDLLRRMAEREASRARGGNFRTPAIGAREGQLHSRMKTAGKFVGVSGWWDPATMFRVVEPAPARDFCVPETAGPLRTTESIAGSR